MLRTNADVGGTPGDFNGDGALTAEDIDLLTLAVGGGDLSYDVNGDSAVQMGDDRSFWVIDLKNSYMGDSNLDGEFSSADFVAVFAIGEYEDGIADNSTWGDGDGRQR